jgi:hypothetical protein
MTSQVSTEPQSGTIYFDDEIEPIYTGQQSSKGIQGKPIDLRDPQRCHGRYLHVNVLSHAYLCAHLQHSNSIF